MAATTALWLLAATAVLLFNTLPAAAGPTSCPGGGAIDGWELAASNICFGAGGEDFGKNHFAKFKLNRPAVAIKLAYRKGGVNCNAADRQQNSKWGCDAFATAALSTFIAKDTTGGTPVTEGNKPTEADIVAPPFTRRAKNNMAWYAPYDSNWADSDELTFTDGSVWQNGNLAEGTVHSQEPFAPGAYGVWYGEDLLTASTAGRVPTSSTMVLTTRSITMTIMPPWMDQIPKLAIWLKQNYRDVVIAPAQPENPDFVKA